MNWDVNLVRSVQDFFGPECLTFWSVVTEFGDAPMMMLMIGVVTWMCGARAGLRVFVGFVAVAVCMATLKELFHQPRPYLAHETIHAWRPSSGFGMPSGHATAVFYAAAMLSLLIRRRWALAFGIVAVFLVSLSRMYFGVHSLKQVLAGWTLGAVIVLAVSVGERPIVAGFTRLAFWKQTAIACASIAALVLLHVTVIANIESGFAAPELWQTRYAEAQQFEATLKGETMSDVEDLRLFKFGGLHLGLVVGVWLLMLYLTHKRDGITRFSAGQRRMNVVVALVLILGVFAPALYAVKDWSVGLAVVIGVIPIGLAVVVPTVSKMVLGRAG